MFEMLPISNAISRFLNEFRSLVTLNFVKASAKVNSRDLEHLEKRPDLWTAVKKSVRRAGPVAN